MVEELLEYKDAEIETLNLEVETQNL